MKYIYSANKKILRSSLLVMAVVVLLFLLSRVLGGDHTFPTADTNRVIATESQRQAMAKQIVSRQTTSNFEPSLEMKEDVDFLLTPALLVQESISDDIILTYPTE
jgi:hypothetical protein